MQATIIGIDCATQENRVGLALASASGDNFQVDEVSDASKKNPSAATVKRWIGGRGADGRQIILALDAPLGWPEPLALSLASHQAGKKLVSAPNDLFRRRTDHFIKQRTGQRPLEIGADLIARTAHAALRLLDGLRQDLGEPIPLAWERKIAGISAIEVYPAATRRVHGVLDIAWPPASEHLQAKPDVRDAMICALAAHDFLTGRALRPQTGEDERLARKEGWIWVRDPEMVNRVSS
jgi:predicted RNase H-like nuclease